MSSAFRLLYPTVREVINDRLGWTSLRPTQLEAIEPILAGANCLLLAPTAGGKTEAAVFPVFSRILAQGWEGLSVLYICPIKALLNNLHQRLSTLGDWMGLRVELWHGDVSQSAKRRALREAPDVLLTPESLEAMLISTRIDRAQWFAGLRVVIADELHALAADDRGWHMRAIFARLEHYTGVPLQRIGLSATVSNPQELLAWLAPEGVRQVVGTSSVTTDAEVEVDYVASTAGHPKSLANAAYVIAAQFGVKRLVFTDSRAQAEQIVSLLRDQGATAFLSHASLSVDERRQAEAAFASGEDCVIVATSTLELGIDVGDLDRVIQIDAPATVSSFLQRMGRTGRRPGTRRCCQFLTTRSATLEAALGLTTKWAQGWVEAAAPPGEPWNVAAQQAMAITLERQPVLRHDVEDSLRAAFPELAQTEQGLADLLDHLVGDGYLREEDGIFSVGGELEERFGKGHFRELLACFDGGSKLLCRHGTTEIGYIESGQMFDADGNQRDDVVTMLSGRYWHVASVDWRRHVARLEPSAPSSVRSFGSGKRPMSKEICEGVLTALTNGPPPEVSLTPRALRALADLAPPAKTPGRTLTHAGTVINRTLAVACQPHLEQRGEDVDPELGLELDEKGRVTWEHRSVGLPEELVLRFGNSPLELNSATIESLLIWKFANCLPSDLQRRMVQARCFVKDPLGAAGLRPPAEQKHQPTEV